MARPTYCQRDLEGRKCMKRIDFVNPLDWCAECRESLPVWPAGTLAQVSETETGLVGDGVIEVNVHVN